MKIHLFIFPILAMVSLAGCGNSQRNETETAVHREGQPAIEKVQESDLEMNEAIAKSRQTVGTFIAALKAPKAGQDQFTVKMRFKQGEYVEHMWLTDVTYDGKLFKGTVSNDPDHLTNVKQGDVVTVAPKEISDWMFADHGKLIGGFSIRLLYKRLPADEKVSFKREFGLKMD